MLVDADLLLRGSLRTVSPEVGQVRTAGDLKALFVEQQYERHQIPVGAQAKLLLRLYRLYARKGLLPGGRLAPLVDCCCNAPTCWAPALAARPPRRGDNGSIMLPWVGRRYRPGGVVVLAVNPNIAPEDDTDLLIEHGMTWEKHKVGLEHDARRYESSAFAFGAMRSAAALLDVLDGFSVRDREPHELVEALHRTARLQSVKCVPRRNGSEPTNPMWENCPPLLLGGELDILKPALLLVLGGNPRWAVERLDGFRQRRSSSSSLGRGVLDRPGSSTEVFFVAHPRSNDFKASYRALLRSLRSRRRPGR